MSQIEQSTTKLMILVIQQISKSETQTTGQAHILSIYQSEITLDQTTSSLKQIIVKHFSSPYQIVKLYLSNQLLLEWN